MDQWLELHELRSRDLIREAELAHRRRTTPRWRTTPYAPVRRRDASDSI
ncbi:hypothetical protein [Georgenia halophila]